MKPQNDDYREDDRLWELIGQARNPSVSKDFSRRVTQAAHDSTKLRTPLIFRLWPAAAAAVALFTVFLFLRTPSGQTLVANADAELRIDPILADAFVVEGSSTEVTDYECLVATNDMLIADAAPELEDGSVAYLLY